MEKATCEKIIFALDQKIGEDPTLNEFDIICSSGQHNKSPVILVHHELGLESWCVKHVYKYAYKQIFERLQSQVFHEPDEILRWTQFCLLIVPEVTKFWNIRKKLVLKQYLSYEREELLTKLALTRKSKCLEALHQRRWLLNGKLSEMNQSIARDTEVPNFVYQSRDNMKQLYTDELAISYTLARKTKNNYHAWNHRLWVINKLEEPIFEACELLVNEHFFVHYFIEKNVSQHSPMHYLTELWEKLATVFRAGVLTFDYMDISHNSVSTLYMSELNTNKYLMLSYTHHQSLFYLRRTILKKLHREIGRPRRQSTYRKLPADTNRNWDLIIDSELELVQSCCASDQGELARQHEQWLERNFITDT